MTLKNASSSGASLSAWKSSVNKGLIASTAARGVLPDAGALPARSTRKAIMSIYPSNYFDPYGDESQYAQCTECGSWKDIADMHDWEMVPDIVGDIAQGTCSDCHNAPPVAS